MRCPATNFKGKLTAINSMVDSPRATSRCRQLWTIRSMLLRPGMFAKVEVVLPEKHKYARHSRLGRFLCAVTAIRFS